MPAVHAHMSHFHTSTPTRVHFFKRLAQAGQPLFSVVCLERTPVHLARDELACRHDATIAWSRSVAATGHSTSWLAVEGQGSLAWRHHATTACRVQFNPSEFNHSEGSSASMRHSLGPFGVQGLLRRVQPSTQDAHPHTHIQTHPTAPAAAPPAPLATAGNRAEPGLH